MSKEILRIALDIADSEYDWRNAPSDIIDLFSHELDMTLKLNYMKAAIAEAKKSSLFPTVGAVVVNQGYVVGKGHRRVDDHKDKDGIIDIFHAEQIALDNAGKWTRGADLYVTLEPCFARGIKPPLRNFLPCSRLTPQYGINRVIMGLIDKDAHTSGRGIKQLIQSGIKIEFAYAGLESELYDLVKDGKFTY